MGVIDSNKGNKECRTDIIPFLSEVCDRRFAERNAEVVCKQLGFDMLNVYLDFDQRIEYDALSLTRIIYWVRSFINHRPQFLEN